MKFRATALILMMFFAIAALSGCKDEPAGEFVPTAAPSAATPLPTPEPTPGPEEYCFSRCLTRLRIAKNDFYNNIDFAFSEDAAIAGYAFNLLDFVYADEVLDIFADFGRDDTAFLERLKEKYSLVEPISVSAPGEDGVSTITAHDKWNAGFVFSVGYNREFDSGLIQLYIDDKIEYIYEWTTGEDCHLMQYLHSQDSEDSDGAPPLAGYRAVFFSNGEGSLTHGTFEEGAPESIYGAAAQNTASFVFRTMQEYDIYKFYKTRLDMRVAGESRSHTIGDLDGNGVADAGESPGPTEEPVIDDPALIDRPDEP